MAYLKSRPPPPAMGVYFGMHRQGEIVDHGQGDIEAFVLRGDRLIRLGIFGSRKLAMAAVAEASATK